MQERSKLEKAMKQWSEWGQQGTRFVLWGPDGAGKSTLSLKFAAAQVEGEGTAKTSVGVCAVGE